MPVETPSRTVRQTRLVDLTTAQRLAERRFVLVIAKPIRREATEALATYIAAHNEPKPDIWAARSVALDARMKAKPVVIGIWDEGVDRSLFRKQLATDGPVPGFDFYGNPTEGELVFDAKQKERWPHRTSPRRGCNRCDNGRPRADQPGDTRLDALLLGGFAGFAAAIVGVGLFGSRSSTSLASSAHLPNPSVRPSHPRRSPTVRLRPRRHT